MNRLLALSYGLFCYLIFFLTFLYAVGFVSTIGVPKTLDSGVPAGFWQAISIDLLLLGVFAIQHSVMARAEFKRWWTRYVPQPVERSTYVLLSSLALILLFWLWQPLPAMVWHLDGPVARGSLWALHAAGWGIVFVSTFLINHFDLFGLRQVYLYARGRDYAPVGLKTPWLYRIVRHPIMLGFIIAFWATPQMSAGHLLFACVTTLYIVVALRFEERDLALHLGKEYETYRQRVSMLLPLPPRK